MKRIIKQVTLSLCMLLLSIIFVGCSKTEVFHLDCNIGLPKYDSETVKEVEGEEKGIVVRDKKYTYQDNDIVIFSVKNETSQTLTASLVITFRDENGNKVSLTGASFNGLKSGEERYNMFSCDKPFASYDYKVIKENYTGPSIDENIKLEWNGLVETEAPLSADNGKYHPVIMGRVRELNDSDQDIDLSYTCIIFDNNGEIYTIATPGTQSIDAHSQGSARAVDFYVYRTEEDTLTWPEELQGDISVILILNSY